MLINKKVIVRNLKKRVAKVSLNNKPNMQLWKRNSQILTELIFPVILKNANDLVFEFLTQIGSRMKLKLEISKTAALINKMQNSLSTKYLMRTAKLHHLQDLWKKEFQKLTTELAKSKDKNSRALLKQIAAIDSNLELKMLDEWLVSCSVLHNLVFFQWRYAFFKEKLPNPDQVV